MIASNLLNQFARPISSASSLRLAAVFSHLMLFAVCVLVTSRAAGQFQPPAGFIDEAVEMSADNPLIHEVVVDEEELVYTLTRQTFNNGERVVCTINRPDPLEDVEFEREAFWALGPGGSFTITASFIGIDGLILRVVDRDIDNDANSQIRFSAFFLDLSVEEPLEQSLFGENQEEDYFGFQVPNLQFRHNGEADDITTATCLFSQLRLETINSPDTLHLRVYRVDSGALLCEANDQDSQPSNQFVAEITDPPNGIGSVIILRNNIELQECLLPLADLDFEPQALAFGAIQNNQTADRQVTFTNFDQESIQVTAIGSSSHFAPVNFSAFTLEPGEEADVTIRFTPNGQNGPFDENLGITSIPSIGAAAINCTGSGTLPPANLAVAPQPLAFGQVTNNTTRDLAVTFSNPGGQPVAVTGLGSSAHFAPVAFTGFTLQPGQTAQRTIRFTPGGSNSTFSESLSITRNPPVGASSISCTGTGISPSVSIQSLVTNVSELTFPANAFVNAFRISRTGGTGAPLTVNISLSGTATPSVLVGQPNAGADYLRYGSTVQIPKGASSFTLPLIPINDTTDEPSQTVRLTVGAGSGYTVGSPSAAQVSITDNDPSPVITVVGRSFSEGASNSAKVVADVTLSARSEFTVSANWNTFTGFIPGQVVGSFITSNATPGASCSPFIGSDFVTGSASLTWPANTTTLAQTISVSICGNLVPEPNERFFMSVNSPSNATLGSGAGLTPGHAVCSILNDDQIIGTFEVSPEHSETSADERLNLALTWTVPDPLNWHDLESLQLRILDGENTVISVLFDEASQTFCLLKNNGHAGKAYPAGSPRRLHASGATLHLADCSVFANGPTDPTVTVHFSFDLPPNAAGRTLTVDVAASDDLGNVDEFTQAATIVVVD